MSTASAAAPTLALIEDRIAPLRARLAAHPLYGAIRTARELRVFMAAHVFAVWDFMSLLKALQARLTCVAVPWVPTAYPSSRRFINEIVLGEESDEYQGQPLSHFELYRMAMQRAGADTAPVDALLARLPHVPVLSALDALPAGPRAFTRSTFALIERGSLHQLAAAFTFGREDLIPDMFTALVRELSHDDPEAFGLFRWYLERHIEVDGDDHGPLSLRMVADLCGDVPARWHEAAAAAAEALEARLALWDAILAEIQDASQTNKAKA